MNDIAEHDDPVAGSAPDKGHLRDFQAHLDERLRQANVAPRAARLGLLIGGQRWLVDLAEAGEIVPIPSAIAPVPLVRDWFRGLVNLRGTLYGVTDLQRFLGDSPTPLSKESRLLAFSASLNANAAIVVTRMLGLCDPSAWSVDETAPHWAAWVGRCLVDPEGRRWYEMSLARLASDERFLSATR